MLAIETGGEWELRWKYYASFISYEIPFRPDGELTYPETAGLGSYYFGSSERSGRVVQFAKILLVREAVAAKSLDRPESPGSILYFKVERDAVDQPARVGDRIEYAGTEDLTEFFAGEVGPSGVDCTALLMRKQWMFHDTYGYWPNGKLRTRVLRRNEDRESAWQFDEAGNPVEADPPRITF